MILNSFAKTDIGNIRKVNEDYVFATVEPSGNLKNLFIVADGMGGHQGGDYASRYAVERFVQLIKDNEKENPIAIMNDAIRLVNDEIYEQAGKNPVLEGMGTTLVAATLIGRTLYVANVGDSRLYVMGDELRQITRDHSWVEEMLSEGKIEKDSEIYWAKKNIITRAIGAYAQVTADFFEVDLQPGDRVLLCSDGLSNMIGDGQMTEILSGGDALIKQGEQLISKGKANGGKDNISVVLVDPELDEVNVC